MYMYNITARVAWCLAQWPAVCLWQRWRYCRRRSAPALGSTDEAHSLFSHAANHQSSYLNLLPKFWLVRRNFGRWFQRPKPKHHVKLVRKKQWTTDILL